MSYVKNNCERRATSGPGFQDGRRLSQEFGVTFISRKVGSQDDHREVCAYRRYFLHPSLGPPWPPWPPGVIYIEVGQLDIFRDEDLTYALRLSQAGVPVEFHLYPGVPHEFENIAFTFKVTRRVIADRVRASL